MLALSESESCQKRAVKGSHCPGAAVTMPQDPYHWFSYALTQGNRWSASLGGIQASREADLEVWTCRRFRSRNVMIAVVSAIVLTL
jgi:hypothetical protein